MKTNSDHPYFSVNNPSRESLLKVNAELIENLRTRVNQRRYKPNSGDGVRISYCRVLIAALESHNKILKDVELGEIQRRLEALENSQTHCGNGYTPVSEGIE
jgi:TfoX/Sxy family transcriptional regulator of competence genes